MNESFEKYLELKSEKGFADENLFELDTESTPMITPSVVIEYVYCPRFLFFMHSLGIPQREELRLKVLKGRQVHKQRETTNTGYLRKKIDCVRKDISVYLASPKLGVRGIVDEVLFLKDGTLSPLDYKYTFFTEYIFKTHKIQSALYALLIQEIYRKPVKRGFICYVRSNNALKQIDYSDDDFKKAIFIVNEIFDILLKGFFPRKTNYPNRCIDCTYRNICDKT